MVEFARGQFIPHNLEGNQQINDQKSDLFIYAPAGFRERSLREQVVVGKPNGHPEQIFIGPIDDVFTIAKGFDLLDSLGYEKLRSMSVLVNTAIIEHGYGKWMDGSAFDDELIRTFGITEKIKSTKYQQKKNMQNVGVFPDIANPVINTWDYKMYREQSTLVAALIFASNAIHEWTHHLQATNDLPVNSLWAERAAFARQGEFLQKVLNSNKLNKTEEETIIAWLKYLATLSYNYRNGIGFESHLISKRANGDGSPLREQNVHKEDFIFGY